MTAELRLRVVRTGGFAGIVQTREIDDPAEAESMWHAAAASAEQAGDPGVRDGFVYEFMVVGARVQTLTLAESQLEPDLRAVLRRLAV